MSGWTASNTGNMSTGERLRESVPGAHHTAPAQGTTGHGAMESIKSHIPGTQEHRMREGGVLGAGSTGAMHTAGATMGHGTGAHAAMATPGAAYGEQAGVHHTQGGTVTERIKEHIPGTREHELVQGMSSAGHHAGVMGGTGMMGGHGTAMGTDVGSTGLGVGGGTGHDTGGLADVGAGAVHGHHHSAGTGLAGAAAGAGTGAGLAAAPMAGHHATTPADTGMVGDHSAGTMMGGAAAAGAASDAHKPLGQKIKEHLPGTREHEEKKAAEGRI